MKALLHRYYALFGLAAFTLYSTTTLANQVTDFSVFQPVSGVSANIYIEKNSVVVHTTGKPSTRLNAIKPQYLSHYADQLYKISDIDRNGTLDIAVLDVVDSSATRFCYKVYSYIKRSSQFSNKPSYTQCKSAAGTVIYATNEFNIASKR